MNDTIFGPAKRPIGRIISIPGNTGPTGPPGAQGVQGTDGDKGDTGEAGPPGTTAYAELTGKPAVIAAGADQAAARTSIGAISETDAAGIVYALNLAGII